MKLKGINASPGLAMGKVFLYEKQTLEIKKIHITDTDAEKQRFADAMAASKAEITELYEKALAEVGEEQAQIFEAHLMILEDPEFSAKVKSGIDGKYAAAWSVKCAIDEFVTMFNLIDDDYFRERAADIQDVGNRVLNHLEGIQNQDISVLPENTVIIAKDLTPSDTAQMDKAHIVAFGADVGGRTSHTAIMARSLEIPAVLGLQTITAEAKTGDTIIIDGSKGEIILDPDDDEIAAFRAEVQSYAEHQAMLGQLKDEPAETPDGHRVDLAGNIGSPDDVEGVIRFGGQGVGLYRTEFLFMNSETMPDEMTQLRAYKKVLERFGDESVIIRTLDIGGDKTIPYLPMEPEMNPFLGLRAVRLCFKEKQIFKTQLRAILRASVHGHARIMFPMISGLAEVRQAKAILEECKAELRAEHYAFDESIPVGIMVEIPSAAMAADLIAPEVDFFSIGTNDLCQYSLAVDRMNTAVSYLYDPLNPGVLRLIKKVIDAAHEHPGKFTGMCGEMAGDPQATVILLGLGLDEFSMSASSIPNIKHIIRNTSYEEAKALAEKALDLPTGGDIRALLGIAE